MKKEGIHQFLLGLNHIYKVIMWNLLCKDPLPSLLNAFSLLTWGEVIIGRLSINQQCNVDINKSKDHNKRLKCEHYRKHGPNRGKCFRVNGYWMNYQGKRKGSQWHMQQLHKEKWLKENPTNIILISQIYHKSK